MTAAPSSGIDYISKDFAFKRESYFFQGMSFLLCSLMNYCFKVGKRKWYNTYVDEVVDLDAFDEQDEMNEILDGDDDVEHNSGHDEPLRPHDGGGSDGHQGLQGHWGRSGQHVLN